jgi:hypothetical protein
MSNLTPEQQQLAMLKLMAKQVELLEAIDWKLWQLHQKYVGKDAPAPSDADSGLPSIDRLERL